jgi:hypothetical protein
LGNKIKGSGVAKNTIKKYIEYLEAAFLIKVVHRVDFNARRFRRANFFKVYLTNPSIRAALFSPITQEDEAIGYLAETAIFSQWFHSPKPRYYARWHKGEVDTIELGSNDLRVVWAVEVKWSDHCFDHPADLNNLVQFSHQHNLDSVLATTRTKFGTRTIRNVEIRFRPASLYCYTLGHNLVAGKHEQR